MSRKSRVLLLSAAVTIGAVSAASAFFITSASKKSLAITQPSERRRTAKGPRNISLRPEALGVARRLGKRFNPSSGGTSISVGSLTTGGSQQPIRIIRRQTETGETVELLLGNRGLTWSDREGTKADSTAPSASERLLAERLILDSPDQFVLAQLRGASYFTIARNVRPSDATDDLSPLWNVVRVDEPQQKENVSPFSTWRLYYINVRTGLPDRVEYRQNGEEVKVEFVEWAEQSGETSPSHVRWSANGQTIMEYRTTNVSHNR